MFDSHIHSNFSIDSKIVIMDACEKAIAQGLIGISFADHLDLNFPKRDSTMWVSDFANRNKALPFIKEHYDKKLIVSSGIEAGLQKEALAQTESIINAHQFDFVIASVHAVTQIDATTPDYFYKKDKTKAFWQYLETILDMLNLFHNFDVVGHIGYICRYCPYSDKSMALAEFGEIIDAILQKIVALGKGIEINTSGYRLGLGTLPSIEIIKRYLELGGEIITLGSDAHKLENIAYGFQIAENELKTLGVKKIAYFINRKPCFLKLF